MLVWLMLTEWLATAFKQASSSCEVHRDTRDTP
jgi:hypothetical protein